MPSSSRKRTTFPFIGKDIKEATTVGDAFTSSVELTKEQSDELDKAVSKVSQGVDAAQKKHQQEKEYWGGLNDSEYKQAKIDGIPSDMSEEARYVYIDAVDASSKIHADLKSIISGLPGAKLDGEEFRIKDADSFAGKIARDKREDSLITGIHQSDKEIADKLYDTNRFTQASESQELSRNITKTLDVLEKNGYTVVEVKNNWNKPDASYKGVNCKMQTPDGQRFEIQFHTSESLKAKNDNHLYYEIQREHSKTDSVWKAADIKMKQNLYDLRIPDGIWEVQDVDRRA